MKLCVKLVEDRAVMADATELQMRSSSGLRNS
jgi:hypothetical protein